MKTVAATINCTSSYVVVIVKIASGAGGRIVRDCTIAYIVQSMSRD